MNGHEALTGTDGAEAQRNALAPAPRVRLRPIVLVALSVALLVAVLLVASPEGVWRAAAQLTGAQLLLAGSLLAAAYLLSWTRYIAVLRAFGVVIPAGATFHSFALGQLAAQFLFNVVGQSVVRAATMRPAQGGSGAVVTLTFVERLVATGVLAAGALAGALMLFGAIASDSTGATGIAYPIVVLTSAFAATLASLILILPRMTGPGAGAAIAAVLARLLPSVPLTVVMHACTLGAWIVLITPFRDAQDYDSLIAAALVVMFISSVPISFAGWGIREFSAAAVFGHLALPVEAGVAAGATMGVLALAPVLAGAGLALLSRPAARRMAAAPVEPGAVIADLRMAVMALGCLAVVLVWYSLRLPIPGGGEITVTLADPFALAGLGLAGLAIWRDRRAIAIPGSVLLPLAMVAGVIALGILVGVLRFGPTRWALVNRGVGGLILLGYLALGPLLVAAGGEAWRRLGIAAYIGNGVFVGAVTLGFLVLRLYGVDIGGIAHPSQVEGFASNRNAFAFQLLMALSVALPLILAVPPLSRARILAGGLLLLVVTLTASRLVAPSLGVLLAIGFLFARWLILRPLARMMLVAIPPWLLLQGPAYGIDLPGLVAQGVTWLWSLLPLPASGGFPGAGHLFAGGILPRMAPDVSRALSNHERLESLIGAWEMFVAQPIVGSGIGAFMQQRIAAGQGALVIHSVPAWLLAETGLLGFAALAWLGLALLRRVIEWARSEGADRAAPLLGMLAVFGIFGLVHDIFYQRSFWLVLGLLVASVPRRSGDQAAANADSNVAISAESTSASPAVIPSASRLVTPCSRMPQGTMPA